MRLINHITILTERFPQLLSWGTGQQEERNIFQHSVLSVLSWFSIFYILENISATEDPAVRPGTTQASQDVGNGKSVGLSDVFHSKSWQTTVPQPQYQNQNIFSSQSLENNEIFCFLVWLALISSYKKVMSYWTNLARQWSAEETADDFKINVFAWWHSSCFPGKGSSWSVGYSSSFNEKSFGCFL